MSGDEESRQPPHESSEPKGELKNIPHANKTISELIELARKAIQDKNWQLSLEYQIAISERPDEDHDPGKALFYLAMAYKNVGDHQMALKTLDRREALYPRTQLDRSCDSTLRIKLQRAIGSGEKSEAGETIIWPSHYFHLPQNTDFTTCDTVKLIAYSIQAQKVKDWGTVVRIQKVVTVRTPNKAIAHIPLSYALRQLGQGEEADMVSEKAKACPDYIGKKTKPATGKSSDTAKKPEPDLPGKILAHDAVDALLAEAENQRAAALQQPSAPKPTKPERELPPSNIDISSFTNFLETFIAQAATWQNDTVRGQTWKKVPDSDKQVLREYLTGPTKWKLQTILKGSGNAVLQSLDTIEKHVGRGSVDASILSELQQRYVTLPDDLKERIASEVR